MTTPGNSLNIKETGFQSFDGVSVFKGRTLTAGTGITITNGTGVSGDPVFTASGSVPLSFNGNSGTATPALNVLNVITANSTPKFVGSGSTLTQDFSLSNLCLGTNLPLLAGGSANVSLGQLCLINLTSGTDNTIIGRGAGENIIDAVGNSILGSASGRLITSSINNAILGNGSLQSLATGTGENVILGPNSSNNLLNGRSNIILGSNSGNAYTFSESSNFLVSNSGTTGESNTIRIGTQGSGVRQQNQCFIAGISGVTNSNNTLVTQNSSTGQLGATTAQFPNTSGTAGNLLTSDGANWVSSAAPAGYAVSLTQNAQFPAPLDSTTYYIVYGATWGTSAAAGTTGRMWIPKSGTITAAYGSMSVQGTLGTTENVTVRIRLNDTTNTNITTTLQMNTVLNLFNNSALSIAVVAGDYIHFQVVTPAWATNPTTVVFNCSVYIT